MSTNKNEEKTLFSSKYNRINPKKYIDKNINIVNPENLLLSIQEESLKRKELKFILN